MKISKLFLFGILGAFSLNSCSNDDDNIIPEPTSEGDYTNGFFVLNEGSQSAGTVTFISEDFQNVEQEIFATVNGGDDLGQYVQSMFFDDDRAYIISNGSNLITVVDRYTFEYIGQVDSDLSIPYYGVAYNGKAYVSNLEDYGNPNTDYVAVIDLETLEVEEKILAGANLDEVKEENGLIYFEGSYFGSGNSILVFDPSSNSFIKTFTLFENNTGEGEEEGLNSFEIEDDYLYALTTKNLYKLDLTTGEEISKVEFSNDFIGTANLEIENDMIYFTLSTSVDTSEKTSVFALAEGVVDSVEDIYTPDEAIITYDSKNKYGNLYGFEVEGDYIYTAEAPTFTEGGKVRIYTLSGDLTAELTVGIGPNGFYFNH